MRLLPPKLPEERTPPKLPELREVEDDERLKSPLRVVLPLVRTRLLLPNVPLAKPDD